MEKLRLDSKHIPFFIQGHVGFVIVVKDDEKET
jgi:hypothetical protein